MALLLFWLIGDRPSEPRFVATYLTRTNYFGATRALIAVTNVSNVAARVTGNCDLTVDGKRIGLSGGVSHGADRLQPGQGSIYEVHLYPGKGAQKYALHFMRDELRTRLHEWVRDDVAPGSWTEPFIPAILKSVPPPFKATVVIPD